MLEINQSYPCKVGYYGSKRDTSKIKYIVMHYTGNTKDTALSNAKYFHTSINRQASAHYFVDENSIYQSVQDNYVAWSVGGNCQSSHHPYYQICTNSNSISIEMCTSGNSEVSETTENNAVELAKYLMNKYGVDSNHVIRHYDVNGKACPSASFRSGNRWSNFVSKLGGTVQNATTIAAAPTAKAKSYLSNGDKGEAVKTMQTMLIACGYSCGKYGADGSFGTGTTNALKAFQKAYGLTVDGKYGNASKAKLEEVCANRNNKTNSTSKGNDVIRQGQQHSINFTGHQIGVDGFYGQETKKQLIRVIQHAMNEDYKTGLAEDGIWGANSNRVAGNHYVKRGEKQYLVTALEIIMMCKGKNPNGVECPGVYGKGLAAIAGEKVTVKQMVNML